MMMLILECGHRSSLLEGRQKGIRCAVRATRGAEMSQRPRATPFAAAIMFIWLSSSHAIAQSELDARLLSPIPGESRSFPADLNPTIDNSGADIGSAIAAGSAFLKEYKTSERTTRGARNV